MRKNGFTLIELLAIIVILSLLVLIAGVAVTNMVKDSKNDLYETQMLSLKSAAEAWGAEDLNRIPDVGMCKYVTLSDLKDEGLIDKEVIDPRTNKEISAELKIKISTSSSKSGKEVTTYEVNPEDVSGCLYAYETVCQAVTSETVTTGNIPNGSYAVGDEYICNVDGTNKYHFFVLSTEGDNVNLIMDRNVASDGTQATATNTGLTAWLLSDDYKSATNDTSGAVCYYSCAWAGPVTAMNYIYDATKDWKTITSIVMDYTDTGNQYQRILTNGTTTSIINKYNNPDSSLYNSEVHQYSYSNLKARLPKKEELINIGCDIYDSGSCPLWAVNYLSNSSYVTGNGLQNISGIDGYWLMDTLDYTSSYKITNAGSMETDSIHSTYNNVGIRPVISVSTIELK